MLARSRRAVLSLVLTVALVGAFVPSAAAAAARPAPGGDTPVNTKAGRPRPHPLPDRGVTAAGVSAAGVPTATPDAYEDDDRMADARTLPDAWDYFGETAYTEQHTIDRASGATATAEWDEDWYKFTITEADIADDGASILFEAWTSDPQVDPVIEMYAAGSTPTSLTDLPQSEGGDFTAFDPNIVDQAAADTEWWWFNLGASLALHFDPSQATTMAGEYYVRVRPYYQGDFGSTTNPAGFEYDGRGGAGSYELRFKRGLAQRLAGGDRYKTAIEISTEQYPDGHSDGGYIVVATGKGFADALSGSALCGPTYAPLLLTDPYTLSTDVRNEIIRLAEGPGATTVFVLGGTGAVGPAVASAIDAIPGVTIERIQDPSYPDRYGTAAAVAMKAEELIFDWYGFHVAPVAFIANGSNFPDALAASPMAAWNWAPVLLVRPDSVPPATQAAIDELGVTEAVIVGGTGVVYPSVQGSLVTQLGGAAHVLRLGGATRYQTARFFAEWASDPLPGTTMVGTDAYPDALYTLYSEQAGLASGRNFPDALAGGVMCGQAAVPLLLDDLDTASSQIYAYTDNVDDINLFGFGLYKSYAFGGTGAVSESDFGYFDYCTVPFPGN